MSRTYVFVVRGTSGATCEDYDTWAVRAFLGRRDAEAYRQRCQSWADDVGGPEYRRRYERYDARSESCQHAETASCGCWVSPKVPRSPLDRQYRGPDTSYHVETVKLGPSTPKVALEDRA